MRKELGWTKPVEPSRGLYGVRGTGGGECEAAMRRTAVERKSKRDHQTTEQKRETRCHARRRNPRTLHTAFIPKG